MVKRIGKLRSWTVVACGADMLPGAVTPALIFLRLIGRIQPKTPKRAEKIGWIRPHIFRLKKPGSDVWKFFRRVKKSFEFDYPRLQSGALRRIHGCRHHDFLKRIVSKPFIPVCKTGYSGSACIKPGWWLEDKKLSLRGSAENYPLPRA